MANVDTSRAKRKLERAKRLLDSGTGDAVKQVGEFIKNKARLAAPYDTGRTVRNIVLRRKGQGLNSVRVVSRNSTPNTRWRGETFHLPRWMHTSDEARTHIKTGDPRYMDRAEEAARSKAPQIMRDEVTELMAKVD